MIALLSAAAAPFPPGLYDHLPNTLTSINQLPIVIANIIRILLTLIAALAVIFTVVAGIRYITSAGDANQVAQAKSALTNAVVGVMLSAGAYLIVDFLASKL